jgi:hypothetical protein
MAKVITANLAKALANGFKGNPHNMGFIMEQISRKATLGEHELFFGKTASTDENDWAICQMWLIGLEYKVEVSGNIMTVSW